MKQQAQLKTLTYFICFLMASINGQIPSAYFKADGNSAVPDIANSAFQIQESEEQELIDSFGFDEASPQQIALIKDAQEIFGIDQDIIVLSNKSKFDAHVGTTSKGKLYIALCSIPDVDYSQFIIYHELSHIVHDDTTLKNCLSNGEKTSFELLNEPHIQSDLSRIKYYLELGKKAFDDDTKLGKRINKIIKEHDTFWIVPEDEQVYTDMLLLRGTEQRADLLACQKLYEQKKITPLLRIIDLYSKQTGYWSIQAIKDEYPHPSAFERALYIAGFLVDKGVDINAAFNEWHLSGQCSAALELA